MPLEFRCPYCGQVISAPDEAAGVTGTCRFCGAAVVAPTSPGLPAELAQPGNPQWAAASPSVPTGEIDPQAIAVDSWKTLWSNLWTILSAFYACVFITLLVALPIMLPFMWTWIQSLPQSDPSAMPEFPPGMLIGLFLATIVIAPLQAGPLYVVDRLLARGDKNLGAIFYGYRQYREIMTYTIIYGLPAWVLTGLQWAVMASNPALSNLLSYLGFAVSVAMWVIFRPGFLEFIDRGAEPMDALRTSWEITKGKRLAILVAGILLFLIMMAGYLVCCVGVFVTMVVLPVGEVLIYRHLRGLQGTRF